MTSTEEILIKLGLDSREFSQRLRAAQRDAQQVARAAESGQNRRDSMNPFDATHGRGSMGSLSEKSRALIMANGGMAASFGAVKDAVSKLNPQFGVLLDNLPRLASRAGFITAPLAIAGAAINKMRDSFYEVKRASDIGTTVSFMREVSLAARMTGESADEANSRLLRFQLKLAEAAQGSKAAMEALAKAGVKDPTGKTLEENLRAVAKGFSEITDTAKKAGLAVDLFGRGANASMPDVLEALNGSTKKSAFTATNDEDVATLAAGWKALMGSGDSKLAKPAKFLRGVKDYFKTGIEGNLAALLNSMGVTAEAESAPVLQKDDAAAREEKFKKDSEAAQRFLTARKRYNEALFQSYDLDTKTRSVGMDILRIKQKLKDEKLDEVKKQELMADLLEKQNQYEGLSEQRKQKANDLKEKELNYQKQMLSLEQQQTDLVNQQLRAKEERSKWTVGDLAGMREKFQQAQDEGLDIPQEMLDQIERGLGRRLSRGEVLDLRRRSEAAFDKAGNVEDMEATAKFFRMAGYDKMADSLTDKALAARGQLGALTDSERNPMESFRVQQEKMTKDMSDLVSMAAKEGIVVRPKMGK